jgi:hypothetical protein
MIKPFMEVLKDCFEWIREIPDKDLLAKYRNEGIHIDTEGIHSFSFGDHKEYHLDIEPFGEPGNYYISLYKSRILLINKLSIWIPHDKNDQTPQS